MSQDVIKETRMWGYIHRWSASTIGSICTEINEIQQKLGITNYQEKMSLSKRKKRNNSIKIISPLSYTTNLYHVKIGEASVRKKKDRYIYPSIIECSSLH